MTRIAVPYGGTCHESLCQIWFTAFKIGTNRHVSHTHTQTSLRGWSLVGYQARWSVVCFSQGYLNTPFCLGATDCGHIELLRMVVDGFGRF